MPRDIRQKVTVDPGDSAAEIGKVEDAAKKADRALDTVDDREVDVDVDEALRELERINREVKELNDRKIEIKADLDARGFESGVRKI